MASPGARQGHSVVTATGNVRVLGQTSAQGGGSPVLGARRPDQEFPAPVSATGQAPSALTVGDQGVRAFPRLLPAQCPRVT